MSISLFYAHATPPAKLRLPDTRLLSITIGQTIRSLFQRMALQKGDLRMHIGQDLLDMCSTLLDTVRDDSETGRWNEGWLRVDVAQQCAARLMLPGPTRERSFGFETHWQTTRRSIDPAAVGLFIFQNIGDSWHHTRTRYRGNKVKMWVHRRTWTVAIDHGVITTRHSSSASVQFPLSHEKK